MPADVSDPRVYAYRAHLALAVGRVDDARADIGRALQAAPNDANALSLQAIIAVAQGDKAAASDAAQRAVAAAPNSATAHIALSYAQQARFDLPGGGGYGSALERDPEAVLRDVLDGYVSRAAAASEYGVVVLGPEDALVLLPGDLYVDEDATARLREEMR